MLRKTKIKVILSLLAVLLLCSAVAACSDTFLPEENGYTATVIYDAGEGRFGPSDTTGIRTFKYKPGVSIIEPGGEQNTQISAPTRTDMHVSAWYPVQLDESGNPRKDGSGAYILEESPWDFSSMRLPDEDGCKLYLSAHWSMNYKLIVDVGEDARADGVENKEYTDYDKAGPVSQPGIAPRWDGHTFYYYYYLNAEQEEVRLSSSSDWAQLVLTDETPEITVYVRWLEGEWTIINRSSQLNWQEFDEGNYILDADIDLGGKSFRFDDFTGVFEGNGHTISNITVEDSRNASAEQSMFTFGEGGILRNVVFENVTYSVTLTYALSGEEPSYYIGLLAGNAEGLNLENLSGIAFVGCSINVSSFGSAYGIPVQYGQGTSYEGIFGALGEGQSYTPAAGSEPVTVTVA